MKSQKAKVILVTTFFLVVLPVLGFTFGKGWAYLRQEGIGSSWKMLKSSLQFTNIVEATIYKVWARASDGKLYSRDNCLLGSDCSQWIETPSVPDDIHFAMQPEIDKGSTCPEAESFKHLGSPRGKIVECVRAMSIGMDIVPGQIVYYALMMDGSIWTWSFSASMLDSLVYEGIGSCSGLLLAVIAISIFLLLKRRKPMNQEVQGHKAST